MSDPPADAKSNEQKTLLIKTKVSTNTEESEGASNVKGKRKLILVVYFVMTMTMFGIAVGISSTWPYLQKIDRDVNPKFQGWTFFSFNLAAIAGDFVLGAWMRYRPNREPLIGSMIVEVISALVFVFAQGIGGTRGLWAVLISRAFLGFTRGNMTVTRAIVSESTTVAERSSAMASLIIAMTLGFASGSGNQSVSRAVLSNSTPLEDRTKALAFLTISIALGAASGSGIQALVALLGERAVYISALKIYINLYSVPAFVTILMAIITLALVAYFVRPLPKQSSTEKPVVRTAHGDKGGQIIIACVLLLMFGLVNFVLSLMESLMTLYIQHQYALSRPDAVWYSGLVFTMQGIVGLCTQIILIRLFFHRFSDRFLISIMFGFLVLNFILYIPMGNRRVRLQGTKIESFANTTTTVYEDIGCPRKFDWCHNSPQIWLPQFIVGLILFSIGYSSCLGLLISLYTKAVAAKSQSSSVSLISAVGNLGRLLAPILGTTSYVDLGPQYTFTWVCLLLAVTLGVYLCLYKRMVPYDVFKEQILELDKEDEEQTRSLDQACVVTPV